MGHSTCSCLYTACAPWKLKGWKPLLSRKMLTSCWDLGKSYFTVLNSLSSGFSALFSLSYDLSSLNNRHDLELKINDRSSHFIARAFTMVPREDTNCGLKQFSYPGLQSNWGYKLSWPLPTNIRVIKSNFPINFICLLLAAIYRSHMLSVWYILYMDVWMYGWV